jgi:hypothetical protein
MRVKPVFYTDVTRRCRQYIRQILAENTCYARLLSRSIVMDPGIAGAQV